MATPKNNRKKGKKRQPMHSKPMSDAALKAQETIRTEEEKSLRRVQNLSFIGLLLMVGGFVIALAASKKIGYPVTFIGALIGIATVQPDQKHRVISIVAYIVYCVMVAFLWFAELSQG